LADALSTAFLVLDEAGVQAAVAALPDTTAIRWQAHTAGGLVWHGGTPGARLIPAAARP